MEAQKWGHLGQTSTGTERVEGLERGRRVAGGCGPGLGDRPHRATPRISSLGAWAPALCPRAWILRPLSPGQPLTAHCLPPLGVETSRTSQLPWDAEPLGSVAPSCFSLPWKGPQPRGEGLVTRAFRLAGPAQIGYRMDHQTLSLTSWGLHTETTKDESCELTRR